MKLQQSILIAFICNYVVNTIVAAIVALIPASATPGIFTPQYISFVILACVVVAAFTWWFGAKSPKDGAVFGAIGFALALVVAFISGVAGVLSQTGSISQMAQVIPNFGPFLLSWSTLVLLGYWVIPAAAIGWWNGRKASPAPMM